MKVKIERSNVLEIFELNTVQKGMLYHYLKEAQDNLYNIQLSFNITGELQVGLLEQAIGMVQTDNDVLRSVFSWEKLGKPLQIILKDCPVAFTYCDISKDKQEDVHLFVQEYLLKDQGRRFNLQELPLRIGVIRTAEHAYMLVITHHHILYDGWSTGIFLKEIFDHYHVLAAQRTPAPVAKPAYKQVRLALQQPAAGAALQYWQQYLQGFESRPVFSNAAAQAAGTLQRLRFTMPAKGINDFSAEYFVTKAALIYAAYGILLRKYFNQEEVVFGVVVSGRTRAVPGTENVMGNFINTLPLRVTEKEGPALLDVVKAVNSMLLAQNDFSSVAAAEIRELLQLKPADVLFDSMLVIENYPVDEGLVKGRAGLDIKLNSIYEHTDVPLMVTVFLRDDEIAIELCYKTAFTTGLDLHSLSSAFCTVIQNIITNPVQELQQLCVLSAQEQQRLLSAFNDTALDYRDTATVVSRFEQQASATPDKAAIIFEGQLLTYRELNRRANGIAYTLTEKYGLQPGQVAGIAMERSDWMLAAMLGVLKAGAAYLPLDPAYPAERIAYILADSEAGLLLNDSGENSFPGYAGQVCAPQQLQMEEKEFPAAAVDAAANCYLIYTSGSTGLPKGVTITHRNVVNFFEGMSQRLPVQENDIMLAVTSTSFDISVLELFWTLCTGTGVVIHPSQAALNNLDRYLALLPEGLRITMLQSTPSFMQQAMESPGSLQLLQSLRLLLLGGEAVPAALVHNLQQVTPAGIYNMYGPTETTIWSCVHEFEASPAQVSVGRPIANTQLYILNRSLELLPPGVAGDLYIGGDGLSAGYWKRPALTAERFIPNPHAKGALMYRTGDIARWQEDGTVVVLGREDHQVKIRGHRVELGEIESRLALYPGLRETVVVARQGMLAAYYVAPLPIPAAVLTAFLSEVLPVYMLPTYYVRLDNMPLTPNGKVDRKALPAPEISVSANYVAPANELETALAGIWAEILKADAEQISVTSSFFDLGGHSIRTIQLVNRLLKAYDVNIPINEVFRNPDIRSLAAYIRNQEQSIYTPVEKAPAAPFYPLTAAQRRLFFIHTFDHTSTAYNGGITVSLEGTLDRPRLENAFRQLIRRHEILRTAFLLNDGMPVQSIQPFADLTIGLYEANEEDIPAITRNFIRPFNLQAPPLMRVGLVATGKDQHVMLVDVHHIISDGLSQEMLVKDFMALYNEEELLPLSLQYKDYAVWQQSAAHQAQIARHRDFWISRFSSLPETLHLPEDFSRPLANHYQARSAVFVIAGDAYGQLQKLAAAEGATLFMVMLAVYNVLLGRLGNQEDVVVGATVAGREHADVEHMPGMFVNLLALRHQPEAALPFKQFLQALKTNVMESLAHQAYPYEELVDALDIPRSTHHNPLFDTLFTYQHQRETTLSIPGLTLRTSDVPHAALQFDLVLAVLETEGALECRFEYAAELFKEASIQRFIAYFKEIITAVSANPDVRIGEIEILPATEQQQLLKTFNDTAVTYNKQATLQSLFAEQVVRTPDAWAVECCGRRLTYRQLHEQAENLAQHMMPHITGMHNPVIGLCFDPAVEMIVAMLAILKCGGAYLPLSPAVSRERNDYILADSSAVLLLAQDADEYKGLTIPVIAVGAHIEKAQHAVVLPVAAPDDLAYVIYTSGSTGMPKGVEVKHAGVVNMLLGYGQVYNIAAGTHVSQVANIYFDGSVFEIWPALVSGASLHIAPAHIRLDPVGMHSWLHTNQIAITWLPPLIAEHLLKDETFRAGGTLRILNTAGDRCNYVPSEELPFRVYNLYGPTEDTVWTTWKELTTENNVNAYSIGRPLANKQIYILNKYGRLQPAGVPGELCIGGDGLARGYVNNPALTASQFRANPYIPAARMYRTGDMAAWLPNGEIAFLGRVDDQVKIRGFRIEPGEIATRMQQIAGVSEALVIAREWLGSKQLLAYYTATGELSSAALRSALQQVLPDYMVPAFYVRIDHFPLTPSGKIDRKALPEPQPELAAEYIAASTPEEQLLSEVWSAVLGIKGIGVTDNFFSIGGDSIRSIQISSRVRSLGYEVTVKELFASQTIRELALKLKKISAPADQSRVKGTAALTPIQQWFFNNTLKYKEHFHQGLTLFFPQGITKAAATDLLNYLLQHHDALRMVFRTSAEERQQVNLGTMLLQVMELNTAAGEQPTATDIENGPLVKAALFQTANGSRLMLVIHHLVVDAVSWRILLEDLQTLYRQFTTQLPFSLPLKTAPFLSWPALLRSYTQTAAFKKAAAWWQLHQPQTVNFPVRDHQNGNNTVAAEQRLSLMLDKAATSRLLTHAHTRFNMQVQECLLAAWLLAIREAYQQEGIWVDVEAHGREPLEGAADLSRTVGWFTTFYPVYLQSSSNELPELLKAVKESLRSIPNNGIDYLLRQYINPTPAAMESGARMIFNYWGQVDTGIQDNTAFTVAPVTEGNVQPDDNRLYDWDLSGMITDGCLEINFSYSASCYSNEKMDGLLATYRNCLEAVIAFSAAGAGNMLTPSDLTENTLSIAALDALQQQYAVADLYRLSPLQEGLLFHYLLDTQTDEYFEQMTVCVQGDLDITAIQQTMDSLIARHAVLRTVFLYEGYEQPLQLVLKERAADFRYLDVTADCQSSSREEVIRHYLQQDRNRKFNLAADLLVRLCVLRTGEQEYEFIWSHHHILMDGWCIGILFSDFRNIYAAKRKGLHAVLPAAPAYARYISWLGERDHTGSRAYWATAMAGAGQVTGIPVIATAAEGYHAASQQLEIDGELLNGLHKKARDYGITVNTFLRLAWGLLLSAYNNSNDVVFGAVVAGRPAALEGVEHMVGLFINTIPVRVRYNPEELPEAVLQRMQEAALQSEEHQYVPLPEILAACGEGTGRFDHIIAFENYPLSEEIGKADQQAGFTVTDARFYSRSSYNLSVTITPGSVFRIHMDYNALVYDAALMQQLSARLSHILQQLVYGRNLRMVDLSWLTDAEQHYILKEWNNTAQRFHPVQETVVSLFEKQAAATPHNPALHWGALTVSYGELKILSDKIAGYLQREKGLKAGVTAGLMLKHEPMLIAAILGILKTGAAYIPIDPSYPKQRVQAILTHAQPDVLVTRKSLFPGVIQQVPQLLDLDSEEGILLQITDAPAVPFIQDNDLAYVIYTSGSTGTPKGVMIAHSALLNYTSWAAASYLEEGKATFALYSSISFDLTVTSIFTPLITGNDMVIYDADDKWVLVEKILADNKASVVKLTPSHLKMMRDANVKPVESATRLQTLIVGGEDLETALARSIWEKFDGAVKLFNEYGPTEATVGCMIHRFDPAEEYLSVPVGIPAANTQIYVLDESLRLLPAGAVGEMYIAGSGLAMGYLFEEALSKRQFISNPFIAGEKMYRTGDLACLLTDGKMIFKGRKDQQLKIRGYRIEPGEIEHQLRAYSGIKEAAVWPYEREGNKYLAAYFIADAPVNEQALAAALSKRLPEYMVPAFYVQMDAFPLTPNGKLDTKALPLPLPGAGQEYVAPSDETELQLVKIWSAVLNIAPALIGVHNSFFSLGGHSLKATVLVNRILRDLQVAVPLRAVFQYSDIAAMAGFIRSIKQSAYNAIPKAAESEWYPASAAQQRLYFLYVLDKGSLVYNMPHAFRLSGIPDLERLNSALTRLVARHEILRTSFDVVDDTVVQLITEPMQVKITAVNAVEGDVPALLQDFVRPFDLRHALLIRVCLVTLAAQEHILLLDMHHIIMDGVSQGVLIKEFMALYDNAVLAPLSLTYKDYAVWQQSDAQQQALNDRRNFWMETFSGEVPVLDLPADLPRPAVKTYEGSTRHFSFDEKETAALKTVAQKEGTTLYMVLLSVYNILLAKLSGQDDITVGSPAAGRLHADVEQVMGMFVNTLPLRNFPEGNNSLRSFLHDLTTRTLACFENQDYQYEALIQDLQIVRNTSRNPLFDVMFVFRNFEEPRIAIPGLELEPVYNEHPVSRFDLTLTAVETGEQLFFEIEYATTLFHQETIERFATYFKKIAAAFTKDIMVQIADVSMIAASETEQILRVFNNTLRPLPALQLMDLLEKQVQANPHQVALRYAGGVMSYQEFNEQSGGMAAYLCREKGIRPGDKIAVMLEREPLLIVAIYGILKAGAVYVPVDPDYPEERKHAIFEDAVPAVVITRTRLLQPSPGMPVQILNLDEAETVLQAYTPLPAVAISAGSPAYVIYTSGSTGKPKGVMVSHDALLNVISCLQHKYPLGIQDSYLLKTSFSFDVSLAEIFGWMPGGGSLYLLPAHAEGDPAAILDAIQQGHVTHINFVPSMFAVFIEALKNGGVQKANSLRYIFLAGEALPVEMVMKFLSLQLPVALENLYGPTEGTIYSCGYSIPANGGITKMLIGKPLDNIRLYVLDARQNLLPVGVPGELYIAGAGLANGYLNNPEGTAARFVEDPYYPGERMYRTGDRVKWTADGQLEFLGRIDAQVKIRGFRIELEEIQSVLAACPGVQDAVVLAQESDNDKFLVAYYTAAATLEADLLKAQLAAKLPRYMVPAWFMQLQQWPLNRSGKLDRKALPLPGFTGFRTYVTPSGPVEKQLLPIWAAVLKQPAANVSANDNFFESGGHSLSAAVMVNKIEKELQVSVPLREVFSRQTLAELAAFIGTAAKSNLAPLQPADQRPFFPLSSAQRRLYFLYEFNGASVAYNLPHVLLLEGLPDKERLQHALIGLIERHSILRSTFHVIDGMPVQKIVASAFAEIEYLQADEPGLDATITAFIRPFDLSAAPLLRVALITLSPLKHALVLDLHHIVADGVSQAVLSHDIAAFYRGAHLPPLALQYKDYAVWQQESAWQQEVSRQRNFWLQQFDETPVLELPADHPRPAVKSYQGGLLSFTLSRKETARLHAITAAAGATPFMTLFAAYLLFLDKLTNKQDIVIGTLVGGRRHADLEPLIGMFVNTLAVRSTTSGAVHFTDLLFNVKQHVLDCFEHQDYPYEMLIDELQLTRDTGRNPLFDVMFMFQNFEEAVPEMEGLQITSYHSAHTVSKFDLTLIASEKEGQFHLHFEYATDLFNRSTIEKWVQYFRNIIAAITANEHTAIAAIDMLPLFEKIQLAEVFNNTQSAFPAADNIITRFEAQAAATPHAIALVAGSTTLTYAALKHMADNIAAHLRYEQEVRPGDFVGFMLERDAHLMPAILGILKTGAAYVPIDPAYPADRIRYMLEDSGIKVVLTSPAVGEAFHQHAQEIRFVDVTVAAERDQELQVEANFSSSSLAYMIYTSGSSGTPKGVMVTHRNVVNFVHGINQRIDLSVGSAMLCLTTVSFDIFVLETLLPLLLGKRIVLAGTAEVRDPHALCRLIREQQVDFMQLTPSHLRLLLASGADDGVLQDRKVLMAGGEPFPPELLQQVKRVYTGRIYNMYGPTETTVWSTVQDLTDTDVIHIGQPIANTTIRILDHYGQLLPVGVAGELCIGGEGLSAGYWQREDLTREKFIPDPLDPAQLIYRTGDLACWLPDGNISFMGRLDDQVKIRGHRIEPGEITQLLMLHPAVKEAVVAAKGTGTDKYLAAWYVLQQPIATQDLQTYLQDKLPAYMVPAYFIALPALPLTPNGKLDRKQLPEPQRDAKAAYVAPAGKTEQQLAALWSEILQTDLQHISADRSFFELGGHSLNAMVMIARVQQDFGVKIPLATFFRKPTITALGKDILIARLARKTDQATEKVTI